MKAKDAVVWINYDTHEVLVWPKEGSYRPRRFDGWCDPIGAAYSEWLKATNDQRVRLMTETVIDLAMQGFDLGDVLRAFARVDEFKALGSQSHPMCRALTTALVGQCLEAVSMTFDELLEEYEPRAHRSTV
jgi:hypothetical protein